MNEFLPFINTLADTAAQIALQYFRAPFPITMKENKTPVTIADQNIEQALRQKITTHYPTHGIHGEEFEKTVGTSGYIWVIDPIDGTLAFSTGKPTFATLIGLTQNDDFLLGVIEQPFTRERWVGIAGQTPLFNGKPIPVLTSATRLCDARMSTTTPVMFNTPARKEIFDILKSKTKIMSYGGDAYSYGLLALGHIDVIVEADLQFYDVAALVPIIEGMGGKITDWQGNKLTPAFDGTCIATANAKLHEEALRAIKS